jgi:hypothetical protein
MLPSWPQANQPPLLRDRPRATQRHGISFENSVRWLHLVLGGFTNIRLQNADNAQQGSHSPITAPHNQLLESESCNRRGVGGRGQKARRRSPQRRGTEERALAVVF